MPAAGPSRPPAPAPVVPQKRPSPVAHAKRAAPPSALASSKGKARAEPEPEVGDSDDEGRFDEIDVDPEVLAAFDRAADDALVPPPAHQPSTATTISAGPRASPSAPASPARVRPSVSAPDLAPPAAVPVGDAIVEDLLRAWRNKADMVDQLLEHFEGQAESDLDEVELSLCVLSTSLPR